MFNSIAYIGSGRIARIMLGGWQQANSLPSNIFAFDSNPGAVAALKADFPGIKAATLEECAACDLVFGALHPPAMPEMLSNIAGKLKQQAVFCSLAPKLKLAVLQEKLSGFDRLMRMNPNSPSIIGQGYNPIAFSSGLPASVREELFMLLRPLGQTPEVAENLMETYAVISAMGPTYFGFQYHEVQRLAHSFGLDPEATRETMRAMLHGTADMIFSSNLTAEQVLDLIPVRPMAEHESAIRQMFQQQLGTIFAKLTG